MGTVQRQVEGVAVSMSFSSIPDPYYRAEAAQWVMNRVRGAGIAVAVVDDLELPICSNRERRRIRIRAGMSFQQYHWSMACGIVHQLFGIEPPGAIPAPEPQTVHLAQVIPLQRPGFTTGQWR